MDLNRICLSLVAIHCLWILFQRPGWVWGIKLLSVLGLLGGMWFYDRDRMGLIAVGPWIGLILLPMILQRAALHWLRTRRLRRALVATWVLRVLHPVKTSSAMNRWIRVIQHLYRLELDPARQLMRTLNIRDHSLDVWLQLIEFQQRGAWDEIENWVDGQWMESGEAHVILIGAKLNSLAERGDWSMFVNVIGSLPHNDHNDSLRLRALALWGDREGVRALLRSHGDEFPRESHIFWRAVAGLYGKDRDAARVQLERLRLEASPLLRLEIDRRLTVPLPSSSDAVLTSSQHAMMQELRQYVGHEARYAVLSGTAGHRAVMTWLIMVVLLVAYGWGVRNGWDEGVNEDRLAELGALIVPAEPGLDEWWRIFTYALLHFGPLHLAMNLLGMYYLGRRVERGCGALGVLVCFIASVGLAGYAIARWPVLTLTEDGGPAILVGASGGVMGMMGMLLGILWVGRRTLPTERLRSQFATAAQLVMMQTLIDVSTPQISAPCHLIGVATGVVCGVLYGWAIRGGSR